MELTIPCHYITNTDEGIFESDAELNLLTGEVLNIQQCANSDCEINEIYSTTVHFSYLEEEFEFEVEEINDAYYVENQESIPLFRQIKLDQALQNSLHVSMKVKI